MSPDHLLSMGFVTPLCLTGITSLVFVLGMRRKLAVTRSLHWNEGLVCLSFLLTTNLNVIGSLLTIFGLGTPMGEVEPERLVIFVKVAISAGMSYSVSVAVAKTVLADRLLRLMDPDRRSRRSVIKQVFVSLTVLQVAEEIFVQLFACQPTRGSVLLHLGGTCLQQRPMWLTGLALNLVFAAMLLVQPTVSLWTKRSLPCSEKREPLVSLAGFILVLVSTVGRTASVIQIGSDITYDYGPAVLWSAAEAGSFVVALCLPYFVEGGFPPPGSHASDDSGEEKAVRRSSSACGSTSSPTRVVRTQRPREPMRAKVRGEHLAPTPGERVAWVENIQSFPTAGRPQIQMASSQLGTTSRAEAVSKRAPSRRQRGKQRLVTEAGAEAEAEAEVEGEHKAEELRHGGILVVTEVRREIMRDPNFLPMGKMTDMAEDIRAERGGDGDGGEDVEVPSLDELPLPDGVAFFASLGMRVVGEKQDTTS